MTPEIQTFAGKSFSFVDIRPENICIEDIAQALSNACRYTGHCRFYSVAEHSVAVSEMVSREVAMEALLHDASEAYISDISSPAKMLPEFDGYRRLEKRIQDAIYEKFGISPSVESHASVKKADNLMLTIEAHTFYGDNYIDGWKWAMDQGRDAKQILGPRFTPRHWSPEFAKHQFLSQFFALGGRDC